MGKKKNSVFQSYVFEFIKFIVYIVKNGVTMYIKTAIPKLFSFLCSLIRAKNMFNILTSALLKKWHVFFFCFQLCCSRITFCSMLSLHSEYEVVFFLFLCRHNQLSPKIALCTTWKRLFLLFFLRKKTKKKHIVCSEYGVTCLWNCLLIVREEQ